MPDSPAVDPRLPRTFGAVLWLPLSLYARHPIALLAATALPLLPGQALSAYYGFQETEGARVVDGEVLAPPVPPGFDDSLTLGILQLPPGWPAGALTLVGWVFGLAAGALVTAALLLGRRLTARAVVRSVLRRLPLLLIWTVVVLAYAPLSLFTGGMGFAVLVSLSQDLSLGLAGGVSWLLVGLAMLLALTPLLIGMPLALLRGLTLAEGIGAAWLLCRRRRIAHVLCLVPLAALLLLPQEIGERMAETVAGTGPALGAALGLKILLVLFLAPLPVLLLTAQSLWTRSGPVPIDGLSDSDWIADHLDDRGATTEAPHRRPTAAVALLAVLVLVPLAGGGALRANPYAAPGVTTERLDRDKPPRLIEDAPPGEAGAHPRRAFVDEESRMLTFLACADPECSSWESAELLHPDVLPYIPTPENPWDWEPVHVLSVDDDRPVLLVGRTRITCVDPLCGLRA
ncbi:hypothetical protein NE857_02725 [Nocardiopsis exhalans]|uniref:Integral membrane protein n=1 Tax=Nocardiopsis exhalans TaxID=163604 RepID=A0ABY5D8C0_9ACTN|nr:hypothetical protein [Nocardiopsis exhalans]USY20584.1 hypothetical protein NE857_02725 [Nocardiopsis exhalans]